MAKGRTLWILLIGALVIRLLTLGLYPLMDTTESRYGEMARLMVETGNWLTPFTTTMCLFGVNHHCLLG